MITALFFMLIIFMFTILFVVESGPSSLRQKGQRPGLLIWLISGNWPAKIGGGLLLLGVGALLRYAITNLDLPGEYKIGTGFLIASLLASTSYLSRARPRLRAVHLAFAGSAAGVAYLTAYSAYGFFGYINDIKALSLLALTALVTGIFAVSSRALTIGILAMAGAYLAPAFSLRETGPLPVYGYYFVITLLSFLMVYMRGWRGLIHVSFLFTLAGSLFFGWTARYFQAEYYSAMQPLLLGLTALLLAMPLVERRARPSRWMDRFDTGYFFTLPLVSGILTLCIAPHLHREAALGLLLLALLWAVAAGSLYLAKRCGVLRHAMVAGMFSIVSGFLLMQDVPWILLLLALSVTLVLLAPQLGMPQSLQEFLSGAALLLGFLFVLQSLMDTSLGHPFFNEVFAKRLLSALLLAAAGWAGRRRRIGFARYLAWTAAGWAVLVLGLELEALQFKFLPQLVYALLLAGTIGVGFAGRKGTAGSALVALPALLLLVDGWWAAHGNVLVVNFFFLTLTPLSLIGMAIIWSSLDYSKKRGSTIVLGLVPLTLLPWVLATAKGLALAPLFFGASVLVLGALSGLLATGIWLKDEPLGARGIWPLYFFLITAGLVVTTTIHIQRGLWPVLFETFALVFLAGHVALLASAENNKKEIFGTVSLVASALVLQAMLLRVLGPPRELTVLDLKRMSLPAVVSLIWAIFGGILAWWGTRKGSRIFWSCGALLLVAAAGKLVLLDFGSLGQLGNILALIAAGLVFLAVAWLAPPPKKMPPHKNHPPSPPTIDNGMPNRHPQRQQTDKFRAETSSRCPDRQTPAVERDRRQAQPSPTPKPNAGLVLLLFLVALWGAPAVWQHTKHQLQLLQHRLHPHQRVSVPVVPSLPDSPKPVPSKPQALAPEAPIEIVDACSSFRDRLPKNYQLLAGGGYRGRKLGRQIDQSGHEATLFDVFVDKPGQTVVLALGAYEPSIWKIHPSLTTTIAGVFVSGYHRQRVEGLDQDTPILNSTYDNKAPCGHFYVSRRNVQQADTVVRRVFGRSARPYYLSGDGYLTFGTGAAAMSQKAKEAEVSLKNPKEDLPAGEKGLEQLVREGKLRRANNRDMDAWSRLSRGSVPFGTLHSGAGSAYPTTGPGGTYVVLKPMQFPAGLFGAHAVTFIVQRGVPIPTGKAGHSQVLDMNSGTCVSLICW